MPSLENLSAAKLHAEIAKRDQTRGALLDATIAAGLGAYRHSDIVELAKGSSLLPKVKLARDYLAAREAWSAALIELDRRKAYHGGDKPIRRCA